MLAVFRTQKIRSMDVELNTEDTTMNFTLICGNGAAQMDMCFSWRALHVYYCAH